MSHSIASAAQLLVDNLPLLENGTGADGVLDLACGQGRNGLYLAQRQLQVTFADRDADALRAIAAILAEQQLPGDCWLVDLEAPDQQPLANRRFDAVLVFNYLHRPLMPLIKRAINSGGLIFYETFTVAQSRYGRPTNPNFLLQPQELKHSFDDWEVLHYFEGERQHPQRAVASLIARRP